MQQLIVFNFIQQVKISNTHKKKKNYASFLLNLDPKLLLTASQDGYAKVE